MRTNSFVILSMLFLCNVTAQDWQTLQNPQTIELESSAVDQTFNLNILLPKDAEIKSNQKYPLLIFFDQQNTSIFWHNCRTVDRLIYSAQIPPSIVVGIPFDSKRLYYTSLEKGSEKTGGIEKTLAMIFEELVPQLKAKYGVAEFTLLVGHSRTAYLTDYAVAKYMDKFNAAISFSGFNKDGGTDYELSKAFESRLTSTESSGHNFYYYASVGDKEEHANYVEPIKSYLEKNTIPDYFKWKFEVVEGGNHMGVPSISIGPALTHIFKDWSSLLWDFMMEDNLAAEEQSLATFLSYFEELNQKYNSNLQPFPMQIWSIGSKYEYAYDNFKASSAVFRKGVEIYPNNYNFKVAVAEAEQKLGNYKVAMEYLQEGMKDLKKSKHLSPKEKLSSISDLQKKISNLKSKWK